MRTKSIPIPPGRTSKNKIHTWTHSQFSYTQPMYIVYSIDNKIGRKDNM